MTTSNRSPAAAHASLGSCWFRDHDSLPIIRQARALLLEGKILDGSHVKVSTGKNGLTVDGAEFATSDDDVDIDHTPQVSRAVH